MLPILFLLGRSVEADPISAPHEAPMVDSTEGAGSSRSYALKDLMVGNTEAEGVEAEVVAEVEAENAP